MRPGSPDSVARARSSASLRLLAKSRHGRRCSLPGSPASVRSISSIVASLEPVSTMLQQSISGSTDARQRSITDASSLTIMVRQTLCLVDIVRARQGIPDGSRPPRSMAGISRVGPTPSS